MLALSCWVEGITPLMGPDRFGNAAGLLLACGMESGCDRLIEMSSCAQLRDVLSPSRCGVRPEHMAGLSAAFGGGLRALTRFDRRYLRHDSQHIVEPLVLHYTSARLVGFTLSNVL